MTWEDAREGLAHAIRKQYLQWDLSKVTLTSYESQIFDKVMSLAIDEPTLSEALPTLCGIIHRITGNNAVVLIDEYDTPLVASIRDNYSSEVCTIIL